MLVGTKDNFQKDVLGAPNAVVDFWAAWCGPCRVLSPIIERVSEDAKYTGKLVFAKVDVDAEQALASTFGVMSIPTLIFFKKGKPVATRIGAVPESEVKKWIDANL